MALSELVNQELRKGDLSAALKYYGEFIPKLSGNPVYSPRLLYDAAVLYSITGGGSKSRALLGLIVKKYPDSYEASEARRRLGRRK